MPTGGGLPKAPRRTSANFKITTGDQVTVSGPTVEEKMQRIGIIINISLERPNCQPSVPGSPLGVSEASPRRTG